MSKDLPYMSSPGSLPKILNKIIEASVPENFNADFLGTKLGFPGGNQRMFISWAKKCNLLNADGTPTQIYKDFRNPDYRGAAMANALKAGYEELFTRNAYAQDLSPKELTKLICEITGKPHDNNTVKVIVRSFQNAKGFADFEASSSKAKKYEGKRESKPDSQKQSNLPAPVTKCQDTNLKLGLNYTINLVLPKTDDPAIYDAIFKSLKENLLDD